MMSPNRPVHSTLTMPVLAGTDRAALPDARSIASQLLLILVVALAGCGHLGGARERWDSAVNGGQVEPGGDDGDLAVSRASTLSCLNDDRAAGSPAAVLLIGGFGDDYRYWAPWVNRLLDQSAVVNGIQHPLRVCGFVHQHRQMSMPAASRRLARLLSDLEASGVRELTILAHSMGGLVAKGALHELAGLHLDDQPMSITLNAFGTPWGGFVGADLAWLTPAGDSVSRVVGMPMATDIGPHSPYMVRLVNRPEGRRTLIALYESLDDTVARPKNYATSRLYRAVFAGADRIVRFRGGDHSSYVNATAVWNNIRKHDPLLQTLAPWQAPPPTAGRSQKPTTNHDRIATH